MQNKSQLMPDGHAHQRCESEGSSAPLAPAPHATCQVTEPQRSGEGNNRVATTEASIALDRGKPQPLPQAPVPPVACTAARA